jgi:hypothetical protein
VPLVVVAATENEKLPPERVAFTGCDVIVMTGVPPTGVAVADELKSPSPTEPFTALTATE